MESITSSWILLMILKQDDYAWLEIMGPQEFQFGLALPFCARKL
jgi:hypothetical protein